MPLLGFKRLFAEFVREGSKQHTIRAKRKFPVKPGEICHCYVDPRQKTMELLGRWPCTVVQDVLIKPVTQFAVRSLDIWIDGERLSVDETAEFLFLDGFRANGKGGAPEQAAEFWKPRFLKTGPLESDLVHWKYDYPGERR